MPLIPADLLLVNSHFLGQLLKRTLYIAKKTGVVHYGIDAASFRPDAAKRRAFREQWDIGDKAVAVGMVGFIDSWKGQDVFLEASRSLRGMTPRIRMLVVGGPRRGSTETECLRFEAKLHAFVAEHGLRDVASFTGHVDVREGALDGLDIVVHASTQPEPFGMVLLEAMSKRKAIIASAEGGPLEILRDGDGLLIPPGRPELLAASIRMLAADAVMREKLGQNAQCAVVERFSAESAVRLLERHYEDTMQ